MPKSERNIWGLAAASLWVCLVAGTLCAVVGGCTEAPSVAAGPTTQIAGQPGAEQQTFASDEDAVKALVDTLGLADKDKRHEAMHAIFGPSGQDLASGDPVADATSFKTFVMRATAKTRLDKKSDALSILHIGNEDWPFPIPLVKAADGKWFFDTAAGKEEILARRIGANELATIQVCRAYVLAQRQYASKDRDGSEVLKYAQHFHSHPGKMDGLYWAAAAGEEQSPFGPLVAEASARGYFGERPAGTPPGPRPFQGYYSHILTRQGPDAPGGRYDYVINGNMIAGFAEIAWPAKYGSSGVMTFIVNHQGKVYEKDLGPDTDRLARSITEYNPDASWKLVKD
jgi:hypothetical protein